MWENKTTGLNKMSEWYKAKQEDLDISLDGKDLHIFIKNNDFGNVYVEVEIKDIFAVFKKMEKGELE